MSKSKAKAKAKPEDIQELKTKKKNSTADESRVMPLSEAAALPGNRIVTGTANDINGKHPAELEGNRIQGHM